MDALDFLKTRKDKEFDGVLIDPPYSLRQVSEHYKKAGIKIIQIDEVPFDVCKCPISGHAFGEC
jgi:16S rRNA G966 N2-methylase RsmD